MSLKSPHRFDLINSMDTSNLVEDEDILKPLEYIHFLENYYNQRHSYEKTANSAGFLICGNLWCG